MSKRAYRQRINGYYAALERACDSSTETMQLLRAAHAAATESERQHRRGTDGGRYLQSVETAARYFVLKWLLEPAAERTVDWLTAATIRSDALYARGLRQALSSKHMPAELADAYIGGYLEDIVG